MPYITHLLVIVAIYVILSVSLNLALGYTGMLNLGHVAFFGIGAYTSALLTKAGVPFIGAFIAAGVLASLAGYFVVFATRKMKGDFLALATLGFNYIVYSVLLNWTSLTRGPLGIPGISKPTFGSFAISTNTQYLFFVWIIAVVILLIIHLIVKSPFGKLLQATRDDELGLRVLGKNTFKLKWKSMMVSAFFAGIAGSLFAHYLSYIEPGAFILTEIILILTIVIVGGLASIRGSIAGAFVIILIPEMLRFFALPSSILGPARQILYALILLGILLYRPRGLFGRVDLA